jgi:hypothetical protein
MASRVEGDYQYTGAIQFSGTVSLPNNTVTAAKIPASAGVEYTKLQQKYVVTYGQNGTMTSVTIPIHIVHGVTGGAIGIKAGSIVACIGAATCTIDLKKNGTTVLTSVITLNSSNTARVAVAGTLVATPTNAAGDFYELVVVATAGGGTLGTGLGVSVAFYEDPA